MFGRAVCTTIPTLTEALGTNECVERARNVKEQLDSMRKMRYDKRSKTLKVLNPGTEVWVQNVDTGEWDQKGTIKNHVRKRSYEVLMECGKTLVRNRCKVRKCGQNPMKRYGATRGSPVKNHGDICQAEDKKLKPRRSKRLEDWRNKH